MAYWDWPAQSARGRGHLVVCVHGLSRQGRDFDALAGRLAHHARVVCPDVVGRGESDWLADPMDYQVPLYAADMLALLLQLYAEEPYQSLDWVGTSMGGLVGMVVAGTPGVPLPVPVRRLVLNDVGPVVEWSAIQRIGTYLGLPVAWNSEAEAAAALRAISTGFGPHTDAQWLALTRPMLRVRTDGRLGLHYDPAIAVPFRALTAEAAQQGQEALWAAYDGITAATTVLRGAESDLLSPATARAMAERGPRARVVEFAGVGHAPTLVADDQVAAVEDALFGPGA